jgi:uncharacterized repeat protein (TIGR03837 family)
MLWDIFCRVIDNYGDIGVSWRLCADLAARGERVRLWVDDASALQWMAPGALQGRWPAIQVLAWARSTDSHTLQSLPAADVWIETFGCDIPQGFVAHHAHPARRPARPTWINLEYLSAEPYVERSHGLRSPVMQGPARGWSKIFFYPGFTTRTGGLLREPDLMVWPAQPSDADGTDLSVLLGAAPDLGSEAALLVSLFCYEPALLRAALDQWAALPNPVQLLVTHGRAANAVRALAGAQTVMGSLHIRYLPALSQLDYDQLLRSCDINFVRGEDSVIRALWAGKPFVWHIYPQADGAHTAKLEAFLEQLQLSPAVRSLHRAWNGLLPQQDGTAALQALQLPALAPWQQEVQAARARLLKLADLGSQLLECVQKNR